MTFEFQPSGLADLLEALHKSTALCNDKNGQNQMSHLASLFIDQPETD